MGSTGISDSLQRAIRDVAADLRARSELERIASVRARTQLSHSGCFAQDQFEARGKGKGLVTAGPRRQAVAASATERSYELASAAGCVEEMGRNSVPQRPHRLSERDEMTYDCWYSLRNVRISGDDFATSTDPSLTPLAPSLFDLVDRLRNEPNGTQTIGEAVEDFAHRVASVLHGRANVSTLCIGVPSQLDGPLPEFLQRAARALETSTPGLVDYLAWDSGDLPTSQQTRKRALAESLRKTADEVTAGQRFSAPHSTQLGQGSLIEVLHSLHQLANDLDNPSFRAVLDGA